MKLTGLYFHSFDDDGQVGYQGQVLSSVCDGYYLLQLFSWIDGGPSRIITKHISEMSAFCFYENAGEMREEYEQALRVKP